jgi:hypothetical protein
MAPRRSPLRTLLIVLACAWGFGVLVGTFIAARPRADDGDRIQTGPLVKEIQALGQLHTVRYNVHDVLQHEQALKPSGWVRAIPLADRLYDMATKNTVLINADGGIEAGVDLSKVTPASVSRVTTPEGVKLRVRLPQPEVYAPEVHVSVADHKRGLLWNDENIVPEATEQAARRFREAAEKSDILAAAQTNAIEALTKMQLAQGSTNVEFYF